MVRRNAGASRIQIAADAFVPAVSRLRRRGPRRVERRDDATRARYDIVRLAHLKLEDVTFVILTKNEADNLPRALESVPVAAPLLVVDAQSTDATVALARARGAEVVVRAWEGFVSTRLFALSRVRTGWTFMLDADEALDAAALAALREVLPAQTIDGYTVARTTYFCGRPMRGGAWGREAPLRLFRAVAARLEPHPAGGGVADVHESWSVPGDVERLPGMLHHYSYPNLKAYRAKFARYTSLEARGARASWPLVLRALALALARAPWQLFVRGGWRDGWRGVFVAVASAAYPVCVAFKALRA